MIGMRLVEREADGQVGGGDKYRLVYSMTVCFAPWILLCLGDEGVLSQFSIHVGEPLRLDLATGAAG